MLIFSGILSLQINQQNNKEQMTFMITWLFAAKVLNSADFPVRDFGRLKSPQGVQKNVPMFHIIGTPCVCTFCHFHTNIN